MRRVSWNINRGYRLSLLLYLFPSTLLSFRLLLSLSLSLVTPVTPAASHRTTSYPNPLERGVVIARLTA